MIRRAIPAGAAVLLLAGCGNPDRAVFVTATSLGVSGDVSMRQISFGYDRTEGFVGPNYVDTGVAPPVIGYHYSDLGFLDTEIKQIYATGDAAATVTLPGAVKPVQTQVLAPAPTTVFGSSSNTPVPAITAPHITTTRTDTPSVPTVPIYGTAPSGTGERRLMFVGTSTNLGLKVGFLANAPDSVNLGYKRKEVSVIPFHEASPKPGSNEQDRYASVLTSVHMGTRVGTITGTGVGVRQLISTGVAAQNLAAHPKVRDLFQNQVVNAIQSAPAKDPTNTNTNTSTPPIVPATPTSTPR